MPASSPPSSTYLSPKRKRDALEPRYYQDSSSSGVRLFADLPTRPAKEIKFTGNGSPRTVVAGHLQHLELQDHEQVPKLDFQSSADEQELRKTSKPQSNRDGSDSLVNNNDSSIVRLNEGIQFTFGGKIHKTVSPVDWKETLEIPETPTIRPTSPAIPLPSCVELRAHHKSPPPLRLPSPESSLTWHDSEITGHDPTDPSDDGYGINGVGFRPTPAIAHARAQKRKQQVAEWKSREAREARQRRSERRWKGEKAEGAPAGGIRDGVLQQREGIRKVRFIES
ncbi:hypothetical protein LPUS_06109 [Lasallia pustulata]|uniref:Uncharacterized protein n=1 Tax=Lasallia pustulata TaxID=136370 RepID=A0A1W5D0M1_9LECA|nr:hypothetical protein LPUS_06109 [Lasallia pustulata]